MKTIYRNFLGAMMAALAILNIACVLACRAEGPYRLLKEIPVGGEGGWEAGTEGQRRPPPVPDSFKILVYELPKAPGS